MISIIFYTLTTLGLLFFLGFGLSFFFTPTYLKKYLFWLSPWFLIVFLIFTLVILSLTGIPVYHASPFLLILLTGLSLTALYKKKEKLMFIFKEDFFITIFIIASIAFNLSPLLVKEKFLTTVSMGNHDAIAYASSSDYLIHNSLSESFHRRISSRLEVKSLFYDDFRWGTPIVSSFFLNIFHIEGYQFTYLFGVILFSLLFPLFYILFKILYKQNFLGLLFLLVISAFNVNMLYMVYHGFFAQIFFWGIEMIFLILLFAYLTSQQIKVKGITLYNVLLGVVIAVFYFSYHEASVFLLMPLFIFLILTWIVERDVTYNWGRMLTRLMVFVIPVSLISLFRNASFIISLFAIKNSPPIAWQPFRKSLPFANPFEMMGFYSIHSFEPLPFTIAVILSLIVIGVISYGLRMSKKKLLLLSFVITYVFFYVWSGDYHRNFFDYNRVVTYTLPLLLILFTIGVVSIASRYKVLGIVTTIVLIILTCFSALALNQRFLKDYLSVERSYISLKELKNTQWIKERIYTENTIDPTIPRWQSIWIEYFLYDEVPNPSLKKSGFSDRIPREGLILIPKTSITYGSPKVLLKSVIWENKYYKLGRICNSDKCLLNHKRDLSFIKFGQNDFENNLLISGWGAGEERSRWAIGNESRLRLITKKSQYSSIVIKARSLREPQEISVDINGNYIEKRKITTDWDVYRFPINAEVRLGINDIVLKYTSVYRPIDYKFNEDARELSVNFQFIGLE